MTDKRLVIRSINAPGAMACVDIFRRGDGSFGYASFRRDPEALTGWFAHGATGAERFDSEAAATRAARTDLPWLDEVLRDAPPDKS